MKLVDTNLDFNNRPGINVPTPSSGQEIANKDYVDAQFRNVDWKQEVIAASTGNVSLAAPGTALDGITLSANMQAATAQRPAGTYILLKDQTAPAENGIYLWTASGAALTRSVDADSGTEISGATVTVQRGTVNADRVYRVTADDPITLGTTAITLVQVGAGSGEIGVAGNGLTKTGSTYDVGAGTGISVTADAIAIDTTVVARTYKVSVGNGALTSIPVTHNLGTRDVHVTVYDNTSFDDVLVDIVHTDANTVTLGFATAPTTNQYRVVVIG